jgi:hypothetical protein
MGKGRRIVSLVHDFLRSHCSYGLSTCKQGAGHSRRVGLRTALGGIERTKPQMFRIVCISLLLASACSQDQDSAQTPEKKPGKADDVSGVLLVQIDEASVFAEPIGGLDLLFKGSLVDFTRKSHLFDTENSEGTLTYKVNQHGEHLNDAETVARYAWKILYEGARVDAPFPCGYRLLGSIDASSSSDTEGIVIEHEFVGAGDGGEDTCLGTGGPGFWLHELGVTYDPTTRSGTIWYSTGIE